MNRQKFEIVNGTILRAGIEWTHVPGFTGHTANPLRDCQHRCKWLMPDGTIVICYAKNTAEHSPAKAHYPGGFENITFHPTVLDEIKAHKSPAAIFIDSMSDLMGKGGKDDQIEARTGCQVGQPAAYFPGAYQKSDSIAPLSVSRQLLGRSICATHLYVWPFTFPRPTKGLV